MFSVGGKQFEWNFASNKAIKTDIVSVVLYLMIRNYMSVNNRELEVEWLGETGYWFYDRAQRRKMK